MHLRSTLLLVALLVAAQGAWAQPLAGSGNDETLRPNLSLIHEGPVHQFSMPQAAGVQTGPLAAPFSMADDAVLESVLDEAWSNGSWEREQRADYYYTEEGRVDTIVWQIWESSGSRWTNGWRETYTYDEAGRQSSLVWWVWRNGTWARSWRDMFGYNEAGQLETAVREERRSSGWFVDVRGTYTYDEMGQRQQLLWQDNNNGTWVNREQGTYTYASGLLQEVVWQEWDQDAWVNNYRGSYTYDGELRSEVRWELWDGEEWINNWLDTYTYANGILDVYERQDWVNGQWVDMSRRSYIYSGQVASAPPEVVPERVRLTASYPNPAREAASLTYEIDRAAHVQLDVVDLLGRRVITLVDAPRAAGAHEARFDVARLPSGMYLYRLQADGVTQTRPLIVRR